MKLIRFTVKNMHGYIDVDLRFMDGMSIIVGGNGSGKTSALTLLANVLRVDTTEITKINFDELELQYDQIERKRAIRYVLKIGKVEKNPKIRLYRGGDLIAEQVLALSVGTQLYFDLPDSDVTTWGGLLSHFRGAVQVDGDAKKPVDSVVRLDAKVTFVRLDRAISAIDSHGGISFEEPDSKKDLLARRNRKGSLRDPLDVVREVTSSRYVSYRNRLEEIKGRTYDQLFRIHFSDSDITADASVRLDRLEKKLADLEQRLAGSESIIPSLQNFAEFQVYLQNTKAINSEVQAAKNDRKSGRRTRLEEVLSAQLASRSKKIDLLLKIFEEESTDSTDAYHFLSIYLKTLNDFLTDSKKQLSFSPNDNNIYYRRIGAAGDDPKGAKDLTHLSSGEKQIVIMLTYLAFLAEPGSIFIVDEPELSLHLKWQRMLVSALETLSPTGCQIVLATHAPEIAGRARDKCMRLSPAEVK